jgi:hypothetical protein
MGPNLSSQGRAVGGARRAHGTHARSYVVGCRACGRVGVLNGTLAPCRHPNGHAGVRSQSLPPRAMAAYLKRMSAPPKKIRPKKTPAAKLRSWRATLLRQRAHPLGTVEARTSAQPRPQPLVSLASARSSAAAWWFERRRKRSSRAGL